MMMARDTPYGIELDANDNLVPSQPEFDAATTILDAVLIDGRSYFEAQTIVWRETDGEQDPNQRVISSICHHARLYASIAGDDRWIDP